MNNKSFVSTISTLSISSVYSYYDLGIGAIAN